MAESHSGDISQKHDVINLKVINNTKFEYSWSIDQFCQSETGEFLTSSDLCVKYFNDKLTWRLKLYHVHNENNSGKFSLYLQLVSCYKRVVMANVIFSFSKYISDRNGKHIFVANKNKWGFKENINRHYTHLSDDMKIKCEVQINNCVNELQLPPKLSSDLGSLFKMSKFSDVTLSVADREFQAHKAILAARSPVFAKMFEHEMKENKLNKVDITDVDSTVLEELLKFIYTGKVENLENMADRLLVAADKYDLGDLKLICEEALVYQLSTNNAADYLILADLLSEELKVQAIKFINDHSAEVMNTPGWKSLVQHPHLILEAYQVLTGEYHNFKHDVENE